MKKIIQKKTTQTMEKSPTIIRIPHMLAIMLASRVSLAEYNASLCTVGGASEPSSGPTCLCTVCCVSEFFCNTGKRRCCRGEVARSVCSLVCDLRDDRCLRYLLFFDEFQVVGDRVAVKRDVSWCFLWLVCFFTVCCSRLTARAV